MRLSDFRNSSCSAALRGLHIRAERRVAELFVYFFRRIKLREHQQAGVTGQIRNSFNDAAVSSFCINFSQYAATASGEDWSTASPS